MHVGMNETEAQKEIHIPVHSIFKYLVYVFDKANTIVGGSNR